MACGTEPALKGALWGGGPTPKRCSLAELGPLPHSAGLQDCVSPATPAKRSECPTQPTLGGKRQPGTRPGGRPPRKRGTRAWRCVHASVSVCWRAVTGEDSRGALAGGDAERRGRRGRSLRGARCRRPAAGRVSVRDEQRGFRVGRIDRQMPRTPRPRSLQTKQGHVSGLAFLPLPTHSRSRLFTEQTHLVWSPAPATLRIWLCLHRCCSLCFILNPHVGKIHLDTAYWTRSPKMH